MYSQKNKPRENQSQLIANGPTQKQSGEGFTFHFIDNRPEAIAQRKLQDMANNSPRTMQLQALVGNHPSIQLRSAAIQRKIDDEDDKETLLSYVKSIFGDNATEETITAVYTAVINEADSVEKAKALANQKKLQRGAIITGEDTTGIDYDANKLSNDKTEAMRAFDGLPGHTDPDFDGKYFTWHHIVPQSRLKDSSTASTPGAVRLGPSASHRYGDPGNDYTDPNYSAARDGTLTPDSESVEAYNQSIKGMGGLAEALSRKIMELAKAIESQKSRGITKPLSDPNQWLIFGNFLRSLPGMTGELSTELDTKIGPGHTINKGAMETYDFASWGDLRQKETEHDSDGISPELFKVLDSGIKAYQAGGKKPEEHGGKIFARGYKECDPIKIKCITQKATIDANWFSGEEEGSNLQNTLTSLAAVKNIYGPMIARGSSMISEAKKLNKLTEGAVKAGGYSWKGLEHVIAAGSGDVSIDELSNHSASNTVSKLSALTYGLSAHKSTQGDAPSEDKIFDNYRTHIPRPRTEPNISEEAIQERMAHILRKMKIDLVKRQKIQGYNSKERKLYGITVSIDRDYKEKTKTMDQILKAHDKGHADPRLEEMAKRELVKEFEAQKDEEYKLHVIAKFKENQDAIIQEINTVSDSLIRSSTTPIGVEETEMVKTTSVKKFCKDNMNSDYTIWEDELRSEIAKLRFMPPPGKTLQDITDEAWLGAEASYKDSIDSTAAEKLPALTTKIEERGKEIEQVLNLSD